MYPVPAHLLPTQQWAREGLINAVPMRDVLHDLRRGRHVYLQLPFMEAVEVCFGTIIRLHAVSEDEEFFSCQAEDRLIWISRLLLVIWHVQDQWAGTVAVVFEADPTRLQSDRYLPLEVDNYVQVFDMYSSEHGWGGWARGVLWGARTEREGIFPLSVVVPQLMVIDDELSRLGSGEDILMADPLPPLPLQISSVIPPPPPLPLAVSGSGISVDRIWWCDATGALLFVGDDGCASDLSWLRGAQIGCIVNRTRNLELYHDGEADLQYYCVDDLEAQRHAY